MKAVEIVTMIRCQFRREGHRFEIEPPNGSGWTGIYEVWDDGDRCLIARFDSSSDAETIVAILNDVCTPSGVHLARATK